MARHKPNLLRPEMLPTVYKGYVIRPVRYLTGEVFYHVEKDGFKISACNTEEEAKRSIDLLVD